MQKAIQYFVIQIINVEIKLITVVKTMQSENLSYQKANKAKLRIRRRYCQRPEPKKT